MSRFTLWRGSHAPSPRVPARRIVAVAGSVLVVAGIVLLASVAARVTETNAAASRAQATLRHDVAEHGFAPYAIPSRPKRTKDRRVRLPPIPHGALGFIRIPRIHLDMVFVQGVGVEDLQMGPGHYPASPLPGQGGNVAIAGHRTTYLHPFWALDQVRPGDLITLQTREGVFTYAVQWRTVVAPDAWWVVASTRRPSLTLTTCTPRFSASERLVVRAVLRQPESSLSYHSQGAALRGR